MNLSVGERCGKMLVNSLPIVYCSDDGDDLQKDDRQFQENITFGQLGYCVISAFPLLNLAVITSDINKLFTLN